MKIKDINNALLIFENNALLQDEATKNGYYKTGIKAQNKIQASIKYLKDKNSLNEIMGFFHHPSENVRIWATSYFLNDYEEAFNILQEIAMGNGINSLIAETTINEWRKGKLEM